LRWKSNLKNCFQAGAALIAGAQCESHPSDFQEWRDQEAWTAEKYRRFDRGERMPPDWRPPQQAASG
jgi:hypothetical protein